MLIGSVRTLVALSVASGCAITGARAQQALETPEQVAGQYMAATRAADWAGMARLMHPSALRQMRELFDAILSSADAEAAEARQQLFGVRSAAEAAAMPDTLLFTNFLRTVMAMQAEVTSALRTAEMQVLGHVNEGADTVHVLTRLTLTVETIPISQMDVMSFGRLGPTWRGLLKADFTAMAARLRAMLTQRG